MVKKITISLSLAFFAGLFCTIFPQSFGVNGKVYDKETSLPLVGVFVNIINATDIRDNFSVISGKDGSFSFAGIKSGVKYNVKITHIGYNDVDIPLESSGKPVDLGTIYMVVRTQAIGEVLIRKNPPAAVQKGDTVEMNAAAFKTLPTANAEELVTKMPGIVVENGIVKVHGEEVKKVLVDGKDFFGEDPSVALKNLPADIIDKVQVFDKLSEQAQFTGFDDGQTVKAINFITKKEKRNGQFGQFYAGSNVKDKYLAGGEINIFNSERRISAIGLLNNINQENFSQQDILGLTNSEINGKHDGGFTVGQQNGINITHSLGFNYSEGFLDKIDITGSYFLNSVHNNSDQLSLKDKFLSPRPDHFSTLKDTTTSNRLVHRIHMRIEYDIDSMNTLITTPKLTFQSNNSENSMSKLTTKNSIEFVNFEKNKSRSGVDGYNMENELVFRHKFFKERRTISISVTTAVNKKDPNSNQVGYYKKSSRDSTSTSENIDGASNGYKLLSDIDYIEPLSDLSMLHFSLTNSYTNSSKERQVYDINDNHQILDHVDSLSGIYKSGYLNNHVGVAYRIKSKMLKLSVGVEYQKAFLARPGSAMYGSPFENVLPNFLLNIKFPKSSLKIVYKTSTDAPSISQLQTLVDNTGKPNYSIGNVDLKQEYCNNLTCNFSHANPENSINYTFYLASEYDVNYLGIQTITAVKDTILKDINLHMFKNNELTRPKNFDHFMSIRSIFTFSFPLNFLMSKLNLTTGVNYAQTPGYINNQLNIYSLYSTANGFSLVSDISENIDFTFSYTANYSIVKNSITTSTINGNNNPRFFFHNAGVKFTWIMWEGFTLQNNLSWQYDKHFQNFNQNYFLYNIYVGKKMFNKNGELKFCMFDVLDQNNNISHTVTPQYIRDSKIKTLHKFFMVTFTYNLNDYTGPEISKKNKKDKKKGLKLD
jgi:hypothetical protein